MNKDVSICYHYSPDLKKKTQKTKTQELLFWNIVELNLKPSVLQLKIVLNLPHAAGKWSQTQRQIHHTMAEKESSCWNGPVKVQTATWLKCWEGASRALSMNESCKPQSWGNLAKKRDDCVICHVFFIIWGGIHLILRMNILVHIFMII